MNIKNLSILIIFTCVIGQMIPYEEPLSFLLDSNKKIDIKDFEENLNKKINISCIDRDICQTKINLHSKNNIHLKIKVNKSNIEDKVFIIKDEIFLGPYYLNQDILTTNPLFADNLILEINSKSRNTNIDIEINEFPISGISNNINFFKKNKNRENPIILVTGFWPPTNEMIRHFSQNAQLNAEGWAGDNWEGRGYDIVSYFPEFSDPDCSSCGQGYGDFEVDYQDTSEDFWPIVNSLQPTAIITFSRGYMDQSWELENNYYNRTNWYNDYSTPFQPTPNPPDEDEDSFFLRNSNLPMNNIVDAVNQSNLGLNSYIDLNGDPGHFVSEFMGYHGVWYRDVNQFGDYNCISAGHVHVGGYIETEIAKEATEITIRTLIDYLDQFSYTSGDVNSDEIIDILDLVMIINNILGSIEFSNIQALSADLNEDGIINIQDIIILINIILN